MKGISYSYSTELRVDGPLLIERPALEKLHNIIESTYERISSKNDLDLEQKVEERYQKIYSYNSENESNEEIIKKKENLKKGMLEEYSFIKSKEVIAKIGGKKYFTESSLQKLIRAPELSKENVKSLTVQYGAGENIVFIELAPSEYSCLLLRIRPENNDISKEIFAELSDWVYQIQAPLWQRIWGKIKGYHWLIFFIFFGVCLGSIESPQEIAQNNYRSKAHQLINEGLTNNNLVQAVDLILKIQSKYVPEFQERQYYSINKWAGIILIISLLISIILSFLPTLVIGIGKGINKITFWKLWIRIIYITIPGLVITGYLLPKIIDIIFFKIIH